MNKSIPRLTKKRYLFLNNPIFMNYNIRQLPPQLRNKLYIICMRNFWRNYIPLTAQVPSWYKPSTIHKYILFKAQLNNIHFLHLPCNTLEENKQYIMGCQCTFCLQYVSDYKEQVREGSPIINFKETVPFTESKWNDLYEYIYDSDTGSIMYGSPVFNPYYDIFNDNLLDKIKGLPIHFKSLTT